MEHKTYTRRCKF